MIVKGMILLPVIIIDWQLLSIAIASRFLGLRSVV